MSSKAARAPDGNTSTTPDREDAIMHYDPPDESFRVRNNAWPANRPRLPVTPLPATEPYEPTQDKER